MIIAKINAIYEHDSYYVCYFIVVVLLTAARMTSYPKSLSKSVPAVAVIQIEMR